ncbi:MAG: SPOR domain-containing protein [Geminicoccaceae bacterium]
MSKEEGGSSYGFAPHGRLDEQDVERLVRPQLDKKPPFAETLVAPSSSPNWAWLLIGVLLGSGGTLMASSLWLQESYVSPSVAMDVSPADAQIENDGLASSGTKTAKAAAIMTPAEESAQIDELMRNGSTTRSQAGSIQQTDVAEDRFEVGAETMAYPRPANAELTSNSETLLVSRDEPDRTVPSAAPSANISDESLTSSLNDRQTFEQTVTQSAAATLERATSRPDTVNSLREQTSTEWPRTEDIANAAGGSKDSNNSSDPLVTAATDIIAVTPRRSSLERIDAGGLRRTTEIAKVDPAAGERSAPTTLEKVRRTAKRVYRVQLAAVDTENAAEIYWREVKTRLPDVLDGIEPLFDQREVDKRVFFRVWIGAFDKRADADNYCGWLKSKGQDCFVTPG